MFEVSVWSDRCRLVNKCTTSMFSSLCFETSYHRSWNNQ